MKRITMLMFAAFSILSSSLFAQGNTGKVDTTKQTSYYSCPHHPDLHAAKAGVCPKCGMKLILTSKEQKKPEVSKTYQCPMHPDVKSDKPGTCAKCGMNLQLSTSEKKKTDAVVKYTCPMHPDVKSEKPGKCPKCGMDLTKSPSKKQ